MRPCDDRDVRLAPLALVFAAVSCARPFIDPYDAGIGSDGGLAPDCPTFIGTTLPVDDGAGAVADFVDLGGDRLLTIVRLVGGPTGLVELDGSGQRFVDRFDNGRRDVTGAAVHGDTVYFTVWQRTDEQGGSVDWGRIEAAPLAGGFLSPISSTVAEPLARIAARPGGAAVELLMIGHIFFDGAVWRFADGNLGNVFVDPTRDTTVVQDSDVVWLDLDRALILPWASKCPDGDQCLVRYLRGGVVEQEPLDLGDVDDRITALALVPGVGVVLGTQLGRFFVRTSAGVVETLPASPLTRQLGKRQVVRRIRPYRDGFVGVTDDAFVYYEANAGVFCPDVVTPPSNFQAIYAVRTLGDVLFVSGLAREGSKVTADRFVGD